MSDDAQHDGKLVCKLDEAQKEDRRPKAEALFLDRLDELVETDNGYAFVFEATDGNFERLVEFVDAERKCCPFFQFDVTVPADGDPFELEIGGSDRVKEYVEENLVAEIEERGRRDVT